MKFEMVRLIFAAVLIFSAADECRAAPNDAVHVGSFSNMKSSGGDDPHLVAGYSVRLYRQGKTLFGQMAAASGSLEPAQGRLFDIEFDPATKKLRFKAKYSTGWEGGPGMPAEGRESRELMLFSGRVTRKGLVGYVEVKDGYDLARRGKRTFESMKSEKVDYKPESFEKWNEYKHLDLHW